MSRSLERRVAGLVIGLAVAPMIATIVTQWGSDYLPVQDFAVMDLRVRDVLTADTPLVGVYSQFAWNHPGPIVFWLLAPFSWISGGAGWGLVVGTATIQAAAVLVTSAIAWKFHGPRWAAFWAVLSAISYGATGPWMLLEPWNPHIAFPIFILFLCIAWHATTEPGALVASLLVVGSMLVQLHVGYVPLVGAVGAWTLFVVIRSRRRDDEPIPLAPIVRRASPALLVLWAPPIAENLARPPGNFPHLLSYFVLGGSSEPRAGLNRALGLVANQFRLLPPWAGGTPDLDPSTGLATGSSIWWLIVPTLLAVAGVGLWRGSPRRIRALLELSWLLSVVGIVTLTLLRGKVAPYLFYWRIPLAVLLVGAVAAAVWTRFPPSFRIAGGPYLSMLAVPIVMVVAISGTVDVVRAGPEVSPFEAATRRLVAEVQQAGGPKETTIIRWAGSPLGGLQTGVLNELDRRGAEVHIDEGAGYEYGYHRVLPIEQASEIWYVAEQGFAFSVLSAVPGARVVAAQTPLDQNEEAELRVLQRKAASRLHGGNQAAKIQQLDSPLVVFGLTTETLSEPEQRRLAELNTLVERSEMCRCGIVAFDATASPAQLGDERVIPLQG